MEIREIKDKNIWENFLLQCKEKTFLQSWNWGEFQIKMGGKIWRLGIFERNNLIGVALVSKIKARRGTFLLVQHGPLIIEHGTHNIEQSLGAFLGELKRIGKEERADFIRMAPLFERNEENKEIFKKLGFRKSPMHANAYEATWKLDITPLEEDLFKGMRKTTRYLIRQTMENPDIKIEKTEAPDSINIYQGLNKEVAKRQKFVPFSLNYVKNEFESFSGDNQALFIFGKCKGEVAAGALVIFWQGIGFYHQAASISKSKNAKLSIPYLLLWEAIKEAKNRGCDSFDFWGYVNPEIEPRHPWAGPTLFKMGFGGREVEYLKTQDFPFSKKYILTYLFETFRKLKRGL